MPSGDAGRPTGLVADTSASRSRGCSGACLPQQVPPARYLPDLSPASALIRPGRATVDQGSVRSPPWSSRPRGTRARVSDGARPRRVGRAVTTIRCRRPSSWSR
jgi:hypothetical protein